MQLPVSDPTMSDGRVSRTHQCRLLYLARSGSHDRVPVCPWRPFGSTPLEHSDVDVLLHAQCTGHGLCYREFVWDRVDGRTARQPLEGDRDVPRGIKTSRDPGLFKRERIFVDYAKLDREKEFVSGNATRSILAGCELTGMQSMKRTFSGVASFIMNTGGLHCPGTINGPRIDIEGLGLDLSRLTRVCNRMLHRQSLQ
jgi:hypothetical protein